MRSYRATKRNAWLFGFAVVAVAVGFCEIGRWRTIRQGSANKLLVTAVLDHNCAAVAQALGQGANPNTAVDKNSVVLPGHVPWLDRVRPLIRLPGAANVSGLPILFSADLCATKLLLKYGADPNPSDINGITPLMEAACYGDYDVAALLISYGANVNSIDHYDRSVLVWANGDDSSFARPSKRVVELLIARGAR